MGNPPAAATPPPAADNPPPPPASLQLYASAFCVVAVCLPRKFSTMAGICAGTAISLALVGWLTTPKKHDNLVGFSTPKKQKPALKERIPDEDAPLKERVDSMGSDESVIHRPPLRSPFRKTSVLVHNVGHVDMVVSFGREDSEDDEFDDESILLARPQFSTFAKVSAELLQAVSAASRVANARERRRDTSEGYPLSPTPHTVAAGLCLSEAATWTAERMRQELKLKGDPVQDLVPRRVYFPLLAVVLRAWLNSLKSEDDNVEYEDDRVVLLITGVGTPRHEGGSSRGNSTKLAAELMEHFITRVFAGSVRVVRLHSEANVFRYDESISFVRNELEPAIVALRKQAVEAGSEDWVEQYRVAISFADGAPARVSTIHRSLRRYRPCCIYLWQLKTFWESRVLSEDDVEVLSFEATDAAPATPSSLATGDAKLVVDEMQKLRLKFKLAAEGGQNEMAKFWHRKSKKVCLAVLLVRCAKGEPRLYHGTNMEVSMPTGSLCAERAVIGAALAANLELKRADLCAIAVLGMALPSPAVLMPLQTPPPTPPRERANSEASLLSISVDYPAHLPPEPTSPKSRSQLVRSYPKIDYSSSVKSSTKKSRRKHPLPSPTTVRVEALDINPLKPCGACAEWLKKIASVNPDFLVVTFTDEDCQGHFLQSATLC